MSDSIKIVPIAYVKNSRTEAKDDNWGEIISEIILDDEIPDESFDGIEHFSHLHVIFYFHKSQKTVTGSSHPRGNTNYPKVGIFAQRKKDRPNHLGLTTVRLLKKEGRVLTVANLDAIDGTPVIDIKPVVKEFFASEDLKQPDWVTDLMKEYWKK